mgnify:FL=1
METIFTTELIQALGIGAIPIIIVALVVYQLFQILKERDKQMKGIIDKFNETINSHIQGNGRLMEQMIKNFEDWRGISTKEHEYLIKNQRKLMSKLKIKE